MIVSLWPALLAAAIAGLIGSGHCLAMCGGIAGALGLSSRAAAARTGRGFVYPLLYNAGRITSYAMAGLLVGALGAGVTLYADAVRLRFALQLLSGVLLALIGLHLAWRGRGWAWLENAGARVWRGLAPLLKPLLPVRSPVRAFAAGMVWGWLPCGMAYGMLMLAWLSANAAEGALVMAAFGLGTLPTLVLAGSAAQRFGQAAAGPRWRTAGGIAMTLLGLAMAAAPWLVSHPALAGIPGIAGCVNWFAGG